ncbi:phytochelatin synthase family protein [Zymobacter palmae]|uniref:glutathione gamma-glutamylcysteinyltransferase n=1 Tax=Zymobacter palmae TaxID=33074 RepID=A0A348HIE9_9GAMM|nr:phytochelatin synthase family protein [Zymobacter palmae]BBG31401.1 uncharacterized homolog of biotin synthetase [Zymobacter palmae]
MSWMTRTTTAFTASLMLLTGTAWATPLDWATPEGVNRLSQSTNKQDLFTLAPQFEGQVNKVDCGVASAVIVLNALRAGKDGANIPLDTSVITPEEQQYLPHKEGWSPFWNRYTQNVVLDHLPKPRQEIFGKPSTEGGPSHYGLGLAEEVALLKHFQLDAQPYYVSSLTGEARTKAKQALIDALAAPDTFVIANIYRPALGQKGGGHFSPLGAYDARSDSFLMMDVSNTTFTWVWVDSDELLKSLNTVDGDSGMYRGFVVVK